MTFDIRTIWTEAALCSAGFGFLVLLRRRNFWDYLSRALTYWGVAYLCFAGFFFLCLGGERAGPLLVFVAGRTLGAAGFVFEYWAISALKRQKHSWAWLSAPPAATLAAMLWFTLVRRNIAMDLAASNFLYAVVTTRNAASLARPEDGRRPFVDVLAGSSFAALALAAMAAVAGFVRASYLHAEYHIDSPLMIYSTIASVVLEAILFGLFLLAVSERVSYDFRIQAMHDQVTGLYNRRAFEEIAHQEVSGAARTGLPLSLFLINIDHFKRFNEEYGNAIGDFILRAAGAALQRSLREGDYLCRWSGDEFFALLPRTNRQSAEQAVRRAVAAIGNLDIVVGGQPIQVTVSVGVVTRDDNALEFPLLAKLADAALFQAKEKGRDQFTFA